MTITEILEQAKALSAEERKELAKLILETVDGADAPHKKHSILELSGLGKEIWEGIDAQEYINELRREWDHRE